MSIFTNEEKIASGIANQFVEDRGSDRLIVLKKIENRIANHKSFEDWDRIGYQNFEGSVNVWREQIIHAKTNIKKCFGIKLEIRN